MYFTQIPDKLKYPANIRGKLSSLHSIIVTHVMAEFPGTRSYKVKVLDVINNLSYHVLVNDDLSQVWNSDKPLELKQLVDNNIIKKNIGAMYLEYSDVKWDVDISSTTDDTTANTTDTQKSETVVQKSKPISTSTSAKPLFTDTKADPKPTVQNSTIPTPKENLYIKCPTIPQFKSDDVYVTGFINGERYSIYKSLPIIPSKQNEISATTDLSLMTEMDLRNLYPNRIIHTRDECMYEPTPSIYQHPILGNILPIEGYTQEELIDNIVRYPHIFRLCRQIDDDIVSMYSTIEINGELQRTLDVWDDLPESAILPRTSQYIKEYVVRRYLLERDHGVKHKYPIYGAFDEYITLFMPIDDYIKLGYTDIICMAKKCVAARIAYKRSRNPILRGLGVND